MKMKMKMTPLEEQVKKHKAAHPGVLLLIEVGYKFHFYGEDAHVASKVLNIFAYQSRNYLTASVPVVRLHIYVRRLVEAGHKVGVIRQTETAALKASGETDGGKSGLFERRLVGLYTRSTLEAGVAIAEGGGTNDKGESAAAAEGRLSSYLLCIAEVPCDASNTRRRTSAVAGAGREQVGWQGWRGCRGWPWRRRRWQRRWQRRWFGSCPNRCRRRGHPHR